MNEIELYKLKKYSVISWIKFKNGSRILCINIDEDILELLRLNNPSLIFDNYQNNNAYRKQTYDYILAFHIFENDQIDVLYNLYDYLNDDGYIYLGCENSNAITYDFGNSYTYKNIHDKNYIESKLLEAKYSINDCYSVFPSLSKAKLMISKNYMINESISIRYVSSNDSDWLRIVNEGKALEEIKDIKEFHNKANSFFYVLSKQNKRLRNCPLQITLSPDRGINDFSITVVYLDKVEKIYPFNRNTKLIENCEYLENYNVCTVNMSYKNGIYSMPYIKDENGVLFFKKLLKSNTAQFISMCDKYYDILLNSSKTVGVDKCGPILERCYIDLVPLNCFVKNNEFVFFDQEFYVKNYPVNIIMWRTLYLIYTNIEEEISPSKEEMFIRYGFNEYVDDLIKMSDNYFNKIRNRNK